MNIDKKTLFITGLFIITSSIIRTAAMETFTFPKKAIISLYDTTDIDNKKKNFFESVKLYATNLHNAVTSKIDTDTALSELKDFILGYKMNTTVMANIKNDLKFLLKSEKAIFNKTKFPNSFESPQNMITEYILQLTDDIINKPETSSLEDIINKYLKLGGRILNNDFIAALKEERTQKLDKEKKQREKYKEAAKKKVPKKELEVSEKEKKDLEKLAEKAKKDQEQREKEQTSVQKKGDYIDYFYENKTTVNIDDTINALEKEKTPDKDDQILLTLLKQVKAMGGIETAKKEMSLNKKNFFKMLDTIKPQDFTPTTPPDDELKNLAYSLKNLS